MSARKHRLDEVLGSLGKKRDVKIIGFVIQMLKDEVYNPKTKEVEPNRRKIHDIGNGSWGKIDFLLKHGYRIFYVAEFKR